MDMTNISRVLLRPQAYGLIIVALGLGVGMASAITDQVPYDVSGLSLLSTTGYFVFGVVNSFVVWFTVPFLLGYFFARSIRQALAIGSGFMIMALWGYFLFGLASERVSQDFLQVASIALQWLGIAITGGVAAGWLGMLARKRVPMLLILLFPVGVELLRRGALGWRGGLNAAENAVFLAVGAGVITCVVVKAVRAR